MKIRFDELNAVISQYIKDGEKDFREEKISGAVVSMVNISNGTEKIVVTITAEGV